MSPAGLTCVLLLIAPMLSPVSEDERSGIREAVCDASPRPPLSPLAAHADPVEPDDGDSRRCPAPTGATAYTEVRRRVPPKPRPAHGGEVAAPQSASGEDAIRDNSWTTGVHKQRCGPPASLFKALTGHSCLLSERAGFEPAVR
jgi:hypothetical protein